MNFFISYDCKVFPINLYFLDIVGVCLKHFFLTWNKSQTKSTKDTQKRAEKILVIWLSVKYKDFLIINNLSQILHVFVLLY